MLPFPYRLIGGWVQEPGPNPLEACEMDEVDGPYMEEVDRRPWMSRAWLQRCPQASLRQCVLFWEQEGCSLRFLHTGDNEEMSSYQRDWFEARIATADAFVEDETIHKKTKKLLEELPDVEDLYTRRRVLSRILGAYHKLLINLQDVQTDFRDQELVGTYLTLSIAAGWDLALRPGFECSPVDQLAHLSASVGAGIHPEVLGRAKPIEREHLRALVVEVEEARQQAINASIEFGVDLNFTGDEDSVDYSDDDRDNDSDTSDVESDYTSNDDSDSDSDSDYSDSDYSDSDYSDSDYNDTKHSDYYSDDKSSVASEENNEADFWNGTTVFEAEFDVGEDLDERTLWHE